jgi:hypothetical protein
LLRARGAGSARAQQLYLQRRGEFVTAPFFAAGCATVTRQANGVKVGQKARGVQISRKWSNQKFERRPGMQNGVERKWSKYFCGAIRTYVSRIMRSTFPAGTANR